jgi:hypothetical protein
VNAEDVQLTGLITAQTGSTVEELAPNAPDPGAPGFDVLITGVAGTAAGGTSAPYTLKVTAIDLTDVVAATGLDPAIPPQFFNTATGWEPDGPNFVYSKAYPVVIPFASPGVHKYAGHVLQYVASLVDANAQTVSIVRSEPFTLV